MTTKTTLFLLTNLLLLRQVFAGPICPDGSRTESEVVAGHSISQKMEISNTIRGCQWVLSGGTSNSYVFPRDFKAASCWKCEGSINEKDGIESFSCKRPHSDPMSQKLEGKCRLHVARNCKEYLVNYFDTSKPCPYIAKPDPCSQEPLIQRENIGGKTVTQTLINLQVANGVCQWVLLDGSPDRYTLSRDHSTPCSSCNWLENISNCTNPNLLMPKNPQCTNILGPDCKVYMVDKSDNTKSCPEQLPTISRDSDGYEVYSAFKDSETKTAACVSLSASLLSLLLVSNILQF